MSKKTKRKQIQNQKHDSIILNTLKLESPYICPNCGEKYYSYVSKKGNYKGIEFGEYYHEGGLLRKDYYGMYIPTR